MNNVILCYITCPDAETAHRIGEMAVRQKIIACANILAPMTSVYEWKGQVEKSHELVLLMKTTSSKYEELQLLVEKEHPYEVPCLLAWSVDRGMPAFMDWIQNQTTGP